jgi:uncharacterized protein
MSPDVNVLVAAFRQDHPGHLVASRWLDEQFSSKNSAERFVMLPQVLTGFIRIVSNPRIFVEITPIEKAVDFLDWLFEHSSVTMPASTLSWSEFRGALLQKKLEGNAIPDAWIAQSIQTLGEHLVTFDKGFKKLLQARQLTILTQ